tara:strand:- start:10429 stop:10725 length:297 start_codon:yes stop_codon:yes gene_type:complete
LFNLFRFFYSFFIIFYIFKFFSFNHILYNSKTFFLKVVNEYKRKIKILFREFYDKEIIIDKEELINKNKLKIFLMNLEELNPKNKLRLTDEVSFYLYF